MKRIYESTGPLGRFAVFIEDDAYSTDSLDAAGVYAASEEVDFDGRPHWVEIMGYSATASGLYRAAIADLYRKLNAEPANGITSEED